MICFRLVISEVFSIPFSVITSENKLNKSNETYIRNESKVNDKHKIRIFDLSKSFKIVFNEKTKSIRKRNIPIANLIQNSFLKCDLIKTNVIFYEIS